ncbi:uncharacterized protein F54H12.2-like [Acropora millepora]|uniref:uncharacterized protein F54H12.2-like n=1 Tax=Acropora millepora TaxID=45264 RepID=UPI001CF28FD4|nr:uncharacterized protein F54H12.2-like [Acropora millepora]
MAGPTKRKRAAPRRKGGHGGKRAALSVVNPVLQVFKPPATDRSITACRYIPIKPAMTGINPVEIVVPSTQTLIDFGRSFFRVRVKLQTDAPANDPVYVTPNIGHGLFRQISVLINGVSLESKTDDYAYKAYFRDLLNTDKEEGQSFMHLQGWYNEVNFPPALARNTTDSATPHADYKALTDSQKEALKAMERETKYLRGGVWKEYYIRPHNPLFFTGKAMVPDQEIVFKLYLNDPKFFMLSKQDTIGNGGGPLEQCNALTGADIKVEFVACQLTVAPDLQNAIMSSRLSTNAVYPFLSGRLRTFSMANGLTEFDQDKLFNERIPVRMFVGLVHNDAYNGNYLRNPYCFEKFGCTMMRVTINGEEYPFKQELEFNSANGDKDTEGWRRFLDAAGHLKVPGLVTREMWGNSKGLNHDNSAVDVKQGTQTIFGFNFSPSGIIDAPHFHPMQVGNVRLNFKLNAPVAHPIVVVIYAEFENFMEISNNEGVQYQDTS